MSGASERASGRVSGPVCQSVFLVILAHRALGGSGEAGETELRGREGEGVTGSEAKGQQLRWKWTAEGGRK